MRINSDHDQELHREGIRSDSKSQSPPKSIPNSTHVTRTQRFSTNPQEKGKGETKNLNFRISGWPGRSAITDGRSGHVQIG